ncbi:MAG TPA: D-2-hydroxyacid dehydrogenase [Tepidisphaeraceae bacterium]|jgi:phosphoglycerate dehydrogenase-like enzyme|nr:D-2-hydroxyacid dehydrogenase [Tepidisphaeraceae bacterium]
MAFSSLKIWCNAYIPNELLAELKRRLSPHQLIQSSDSQISNLASVGTNPEARGADVVYGQPHPEDVIHSTSLKWVHLTTAGYTRYDTDAMRKALRSRGAVMTNSSSMFADPCAEHALAFMLCAARCLAPMIVNDATKHEWPYLETRSEARLLRGQSALLVGFGAIARRMVELLSPFQMNLTAVRRTVQGDEPVPTIAVSRIEEALGDVDHVVNILPAADHTKQFFNATRFAKMRQGTTFYNIGRGDTVDQDALCDALESGHIRGAYLDVTTPEPLPPEHRLWSARNCWITPHTAGGYADEVRANIEHFVENFQRFVREEELRDRIV